MEDLCRTVIRIINLNIGSGIYILSSYIQKSGPNGCLDDIVTCSRMDLLKVARNGRKGIWFVFKIYIAYECFVLIIIPY